MKSIKTRIDECVNIRCQLQSMGLFVIQKNNDIVSKYMNDFVKTGESQYFSLSLPEQKLKFIVTLTAKEKQSGVVMEHL